MTETNRFVVAETFGVKAPRGLTVEGFTDPTHPQIPREAPLCVSRGAARCAGLSRRARGAMGFC